MTESDCALEFPPGLYVLTPKDGKPILVEIVKSPSGILIFRNGYGLEIPIREMVRSLSIRKATLDDVKPAEGIR